MIHDVPFCLFLLPFVPFCLSTETQLSPLAPRLATPPLICPVLPHQGQLTTLSPPQQLTLPQLHLTRLFASQEGQPGKAAPKLNEPVISLRSYPSRSAAFAFMANAQSAIQRFRPFSSKRMPNSCRERRQRPSTITTFKS